VAAPEQVDVWVGLDVGKNWVGLDVGKKEHFADVLDDGGERLFARAVANSRRIWRRCWTALPGMGRRAR
jgi:hypothetical protein